VAVARERFSRKESTDIVNEFGDGDGSVVFKVRCKSDLVYGLMADELDRFTAIAKVHDELFYIEVKHEVVAVYDATFDYSNTRANVLAANKQEARENARFFIETQKQQIIEQIDFDLEATVRDMSTSVSVSETDTTHYEIDRDGEWSEGEL